MDNWVVALCDGSLGGTDKEITICRHLAKNFPVIPRIGESIVVNEGYFSICHVSHNMKTKTITLWIDPKQSDYN